MEAYQERVLEERQQLVDKFDKLTSFLKGNIFHTLPSDEQDRLTRQHGIMEQYANVLAERIVNFK